MSKSDRLATLVRAIAKKMLAACKNCSGNGRWWSHGEWFECRDCRDVRRALAALDAEQGGEGEVRVLWRAEKEG